MITFTPANSSNYSNSKSKLGNQNLNNNTPVSLSQHNLSYDTVSFKAKPSAKTAKKAGGVVADIYKSLMDKITNGEGLSKAERATVKKLHQQKEKELAKLQKENLQLGMILDNDKLRQKGVDGKTIKRYVKEDNAAVKKAEKFTAKNLKLKYRMFGYPANMVEDSAVTKHLRTIETKNPLMNNCGDPYQVANYRMDNKVDYEQPILEKVYKHLGFEPKSAKGVATVKNPDKPWGYITTGGSESNKWGIYNGISTFPEGRVYYSKASHYSVAKALEIDKNGNAEKGIDLLKHTPIPTKQGSESIDAEKLVETAKKNWEEKKEPAVVFLTWGTTKTGAIDDVVNIKKSLTKAGVPHYIHLDAALYGGIPANQKGAPVIPSMKQVGYDSAAISMHKYLGNHEVHSIVVAKEVPMSKTVDYIGGIKDSTTAGSRSMNPFSALQRTTENYERKLPEEYIENINYFDKQLKKNKVSFERADQANTYVISKPSKEICEKYQLSTFDNDKKAHIIIFPHHKKRIMSEFAKALGQDAK